MDQSLLKYRIALSLIKGIGPKLARNLIAYLKSEAAFFEEKLPTLRKVPGIGPTLEQLLRNIDRKSLLNQAEEECLFIQKHHITPIFFSDQDYPRRLSYCDDAPLMLYIKGKKCYDAARTIAIVGTRTPTDEGLELCEKLVSDLAERHPGTVIVSGLAYGIDVCAHKTALKKHLPTIGVLGHGLDRIYPFMHRQIAREMLGEGALITEFRSKTKPDRHNFVQRNRIIAGLSDAVVVVQSAVKGGALITAQLASDYNRDVLAFPGRPSDTYSKGCNYLIKSNVAALIESAEDLEYILGWEPGVQHPESVQGNLFTTLDSEEQQKVMETLMAEKELNMNILSLKCGIPVSKLSSILLELEFKGLVKSKPGGIYRAILSS
ncbi:DNA-processing protein DprA [Thermophagus xiamenensis]|uniref:DNA processing protein n=1 Tax=Thermophagus xiamenensis TaxID=385682 RepID=A0A1I1XY06_9BACT|nr:DNA-processing protein DprA [Thermophagus xiamenensis]SFE12161.1 DNA processing protein [Thermophagus xiamenensis]